jgi:hypothetical protein
MPDASREPTQTERLRSALGRLLEWWPEGSETGRLDKGGSFAADIQNARKVYEETGNA